MTKFFIIVGFDILGTLLFAFIATWLFNQFTQLHPTFATTLVTLLTLSSVISINIATSKQVLGK